MLRRTPGRRPGVAAGEDVANELADWFNAVDATYRADLRELNELNFSRFDPKLEQRLPESDAKWEQRPAEWDISWERRLAEFRKEFAHLRAERVRWMFLFWAPKRSASSARR